MSNFYPIVWSNWHDSIAFPPRSYEVLSELEDGVDITPSDLQEFEADDWNPWDDLNSENGVDISTNELQRAIHYWLNAVPIENTDAKVTDKRLQYLINCWINA